MPFKVEKRRFLVFVVGWEEKLELSVWACLADNFTPSSGIDYSDSESILLVKIQITDSYVLNASNKEGLVHNAMKRNDGWGST